MHARPSRSPYPSQHMMSTEAHPTKIGNMTKKIAPSFGRFLRLEVLCLRSYAAWFRVGCMGGRRGGRKGDFWGAARLPKGSRSRSRGGGRGGRESRGVQRALRMGPSLSEFILMNNTESTWIVIPQRQKHRRRRRRRRKEGDATRRGTPSPLTSLPLALPTPIWGRGVLKRRIPSTEGKGNVREELTGGVGGKAMGGKDDTREKGRAVFGEETMINGILFHHNYRSGVRGEKKQWRGIPPWQGGYGRWGGVVVPINGGSSGKRRQRRVGTRGSPWKHAQMRFIGRDGNIGHQTRRGWMPPRRCQRGRPRWPPSCPPPHRHPKKKRRTPKGKPIPSPPRRLTRGQKPAASVARSEGERLAGCLLPHTHAALPSPPMRAATLSRRAAAAEYTDRWCGHRAQHA